MAKAEQAAAMVKARTNATREEEAKENEKVRKELVAAMARKARAEAKPAYGVTERGERSNDGSNFGFTRVGWATAALCSGTARCC